MGGLHLPQIDPTGHQVLGLKNGSIRDLGAYDMDFEVVDETKDLCYRISLSDGMETINETCEGMWS